MPAEKQITSTGLIYLIVVYLVWGSTYLFIRIAVQADGGVPPFILGMTRVFTAGSILLLWAAIRKNRLRLTPPEWITLATSGVLLWVGGNGFLSWGEQRIESGMASLMIAAIPIWVALIEMALDRKLPSLSTVISLSIGFLGIGVLSIPTLRGGSQHDILSILALLFAGFSWGLGSVLQSRRPVAVSPLVSSGYQQVFGALGFGVMVWLTGETFQMPGLQSLMAWGYLVIFGSLIAFTAYITTIKLLPMKIVATYAYANPVVAVFLGRLVLGEQITVWTLLGAALVLLGIAGVFRERYHSTKI